MNRGAGFRLIAAVLVYSQLAWPTLVAAQSSRGGPSAGIVTTLSGEATLVRADRPAQPVSLKFKDEVFTRDRISTKQNSIARVLLGGKSLVTVRELSDLTITEAPGKPSILDVFSGKIALAVARLRMRPGETIEVRTPNAVAAVRGTVLVVEVTPGTPNGEAKPRKTAFTGGATPVQAPGFNTTIHVTQGRVDVFDLGGTLRQTIPAGMSQDIIGNVFQAPRPNPPNVFAGLNPGAQHLGTPQEATEGIAGFQEAQALALADNLGGTPPPPPPPPVNACPPLCVQEGQEPVLGEPIVTFSGFTPSIHLQAPLALIQFDETPGASPRPPTPLAFSAESLGTTDVFIIEFNPFDPEQTPGQILEGDGIAIRTPYFATSTGVDGEGFFTGDVPVTLPGGIGLTDSHVFANEFDVFVVDDAVANLTGSALRLNNSVIQDAEHIIGIGSTLNQTLGDPLLDIQNSAVSSFSDTVSVNDGVLNTAGAVVSASGVHPSGMLAINAGSDLFELSDSIGVVGSVLTMSNGAQGFVDSDAIDLNSSSLMVNGNAVQVTNAHLFVDSDIIEADFLGPDEEGLTVTGTVLAASGPPPEAAETMFTVIVDGDVLDLDNTQATIGSALTIGNGAKVRVDGSVFNIFESTVTVNGTAVQITNGSLEAEALAYVGCIDCGGAPSSLIINGSLLTSINGAITLFETVEIDGFGDQLNLVLGANQPVIGLTNSTLTLTGEGANLVAFENFTGETRNQTGVALIANQSTINLESDNRLLRLFDSVFDSLNLTDANYQIQLSNSVVNHVGSSSVITVKGNGLVTTNGGLLNAMGSLIRSESVFHEETGLTDTSGCCPISVALTPNGRTAYVANGGDLGDSTVDVFDTLSKTKIATVDLSGVDGEGSPVGVAVTPDGARAFVAHGGGEGCSPCSTVSIINTATNTLQGTINLGEGVRGPRNIAFTPNGSLAYVTNQFSDNVSVINTATNAVVATIPVGETPFGVAVSPDGTRAYVANQSDNTVTVINTATNTVVGVPIPVGSRPFQIGITPDGQQAYVANNNSNTVSVINTATNAVVATIAVGSRPRGIAVSPDGGRVYVTNRDSDSVSVINTRTNTLIDTVFLVSGEGSPNGVAVAADGTQRVFVVNEFDNSVSVVEPFINNTLMEVFQGTTYQHNGTMPVFLFDSSIVTVGEGVHTNGNMDLGTAELFRANNSILTIPEEIVHVENPGRIAAAGPGNVVTIVGGVHGLSFNPDQAILTLEACCATDDVEAIRSRTVNSGKGPLVLPAVNITVGTTKPLHGGTLETPAPLQRTLLGATDTDIVTNQLVKLDPALLDTVAAFLNLTTGTLGSFNSLATIGPQSHLQATLVSPTTGLANLNNSTLTVVNGPAFSVTGGSFFHLPTGSLFSANNTSLFSILNGALASITGNSVLRIDNGHLGAFGPTGTNVLNLANAPACSSGTCVPLLLTGFNILLLNGATAGNNLAINPAFVPFQDLGGSNSVTVGNNGPGDTRALIVVDGAGSFLQLGPVVDFVPPPPPAGGAVVTFTNYNGANTLFPSIGGNVPVASVTTGSGEVQPTAQDFVFPDPVPNGGANAFAAVDGGTGITLSGGVKLDNTVMNGEGNDAFFDIVGANVTIQGTAIELVNNSEIRSFNTVMRIRSSLTSLSPNPIINLVGAGGAFFGITDVFSITNGTVSTNGPAIMADAQTISGIGDIFFLDTGASFQSAVTPGATLQFDGTFVEMGGVVALDQLTPGTPPRFFTEGPLVTANNTPMVISGGGFIRSTVPDVDGVPAIFSPTTDPYITTNGGSLILNGVNMADIANGTFQTGGTFYKATGTIITPATTVTFLNLNNADFIVGSPILDWDMAGATSTTVNFGSQPLARLVNGSMLKNNGGAVLKFANATITADALAFSDGQFNIFDFTGSVLDLTNTSLTLNRLGGTPDGVPDNDTFSIVLGPNEAYINMVNSTLTLNNVGEELVFFGNEDTPGGTGIQGGVAVKAVGSGGTTINVKGPVLALEALSGNLTLTDGNPQIQLTNETVNQTATTLGMVQVIGHAVEIRGNTGGQGQLMHAVNSHVNLSGDFLQAVGFFDTGENFVGASLHVVNMAPLATLINGSSLNADILFNLAGDFLSPGFEPLHGLTGPGGTRIALPATMLATSGTGPNTITANHFVKVDAALLEATKPFIDALNATMTFNSDFAKFVNGSTFNTPGVLSSDALTMVSLNASSLTINNGHLVKVVDPGATFSFIGSLFTLLNGSTLTINNGTVASASGGGIFNLTGSIGAFGAGVNTFSVSNTLCAAGGCTNIPSGLSGPGQPTTIPVLGNVVANGGFTAFTGSGLANAVVNISPNAAVISATNGGTANLNAPPPP